MIYDLQENDIHCVKQIIKKFETYPSIVEIKKNIDILEKNTAHKTRRSQILTHYLNQ